MPGKSRDLVANITMDPSGFVKGSQTAQASARALHAAQLRLVAAQERLTLLQASGKATAGQLAAAQAGVISAQDRVAKATTRTATVMSAGAAKSAKALDGVKTAAAGMGIGVGLGAAAAGTAIVAMARKSVDAASGLNEQLAATRTMFRDAADDVIGFAESAEALGMSERAALQAANAYGDMFVKLGYTHQAAAVFSEDLVRLAADFASFKDMDPGDVLLKLRSGLSGEAEPLRSLGIFLNEAAVKAEAMALGLGSANGKLTEAEKVSARYSLILKNVGDAQNDVARTADSYANTQRRAAAASENLKAQIGQGLLPVFTDLAFLAAEATGALTGVTRAAGDTGTAGRMLSEFGSAIERQIVPATWLADAVRKLSGESEDAATSADYLADSHAILADAENHTREEVEQATAAIEAQEEALGKLLRATIAQFDSEMAYTLSMLGVTDALADYDEALKKNSDGKADNDLSAEELRRTELGLSQALLDVGAAAVKQAEDHAAAAGTVLSESEKYTVFRDELIKLKEQFPQLAGQIDGYVSRLNEVPAEVSTTATADTAPATGALSLLNTVLSETDRRVATPTVLADTSQAITGLRAVDHLLDSLSGRSVSTAVTTTRTTRELMLPGGLGKAAGGLVGRAAGGLIYGPGTGTSDSVLGIDGRGVPTARVSAGEFVQREAAVSKYGVGFMHAVNSLQLSQAAARESMSALSRMPLQRMPEGLAAGGLVTMATGGSFDPFARLAGANR